MQIRAFSREPFGGGEITCIDCKKHVEVLSDDLSAFIPYLEGSNLFSCYDKLGSREISIIRCKCGVGAVHVKDKVSEPSVGGGVYDTFTIVATLLTSPDFGY